MNPVKKIGKYTQMYSQKVLKREKNVIVFGAWLGERFTDNSMQLFLEASEIKALKCVWVTKNKDVYEQIRSMGLKVVMWGSEHAVRVHKRAGYAVVSNGISDVMHEYLGGAVILDLWHGIPLKKIGFDDNIKKNYDSFSQKTKRFFKYFPFKDIYYFAPSENFRDIYKSAFRTDDKHVITLGQPRCDCFFADDDSDGVVRELNTDEKYFPSKKIILYCPTHRQEGKVEIKLDEIFNLDSLENFLQNKDYYLVVKKHFYHKDEDESEVLRKYNRIIDITKEDYDIQKLVMECKLLITDYSSIYIDYLLLNKPLLFYCYDYDNYLKNDREMYFPYDEVTPGNKAYDFEGLIENLYTFSEESVEFGRDERERLKNFFYCSKGQKRVGHEIISMIVNDKF